MTNPVIETNIERILEDHLLDEIIAINNKIMELNESVMAYKERKEKLMNIAHAAGITFTGDAT